MNKRDTSIDITKAIGILLMILGHCTAIPYMPYRHFIFTFHMPLFFIISGYFFKSKEIKTSLKSDTRHLMTPYFITCIAVILLTFIKSLYSGKFELVLHYIAAMFIASGSYIFAFFCVVWTLCYHIFCNRRLLQIRKT